MPNLIRKIRAGDTLMIEDVAIQVESLGDKQCKVCISCDESVLVTHVPAGDVHWAGECKRCGTKCSLRNVEVPLVCCASCSASVRMFPVKESRNHA